MLRENGMPDRQLSLLVPLEADGVRLDRYLGEALRDSDVSREKLKRAIREGACVVAGVPCSDVKRRVHAGETVVVTLPAQETSVQPESGAIEIVWQDEHLVIVNKPAGLTVHPAPSCPEGTLVHRLVAHFPSLRAQEGFRPGIVHRLDKDTSGLLCVALTEEARMRLSTAFAEREIHKEYLALVRGEPRTEGEIDEPLGRHPTIKVKVAVVKNGKPARSAWRVLWPGRGWALTAVRIFTGRTHQIRVHMAQSGYPLWGDRLYGSEAGCPGTALTRDPAPRQMLHAWKLQFIHPFTGETLAFCCPPPADFYETAALLNKQMHRVVVTGVAGCGKSLFIQTLMDLGVPVWSADAAVIRLYEPGGEAWQALYQRFGNRFIPDMLGPVDRKALASAVLPGPDGQRPELGIEDLSALIHPLVFADLERFWQEQEAGGHDFAVAEVPLWFESTVGKSPVPRQKRPFLVGIHCDEQERQRRLLSVRGWSEAMMAEMDAKQWSQEQKMAGCDLVIENSGSPEALIEKTRHFVDQMRRWPEKDRIRFQAQWEKLVAPSEERALF